MNLSKFVLILRARLRIFLMILATTTFTALAVSLLMPKTYTATTTLVLNYKGTDPVTGITLPSQLMPGYMTTQVDIINSTRAALRVVDDLRLAEGAEVRKIFMDATEGRGSIRDWKATALLKKLEVVPSRESSVLNVSFSDRDPEVAAAIVNAFAAAYQNISIRLRMDPSKKAASYFNEQIARLRENFEAAQKKLSSYQQENGIVSADYRFDMESARLADLSNQLTAAQGQRTEAAARRDQAQRADASDSPDIMASPLIQNLKLQLAQAESKFAAVAERFTRDHPYYERSRAEVARLRADLSREIKSASGSIAGTERIQQQRVTELRAAVEKQKARVLDFNRKRDEIRVLTNEMESAQRAYEAATQRYFQANLEGQSEQTDVAVLNTASAPTVATAPKVLFNTLLAFILGAMLGLGAALLSELFDRRVRSADDLLQSMQAPVLGTMIWRPQRRRVTRLKTLLGPRRLLVR